MAVREGCPLWLVACDRTGKPGAKRQRGRAMRADMATCHAIRRYGMYMPFAKNRAQHSSTSPVRETGDSLDPGLHPPVRPAPEREEMRRKSPASTVTPQAIFIRPERWGTLRKRPGISEFRGSVLAEGIAASERAEGMTWSQAGDTDSAASHQAGCVLLLDAHGTGFIEASRFHPPDGLGFALSAGFGASSHRGWTKGRPRRSTAETHACDGPDQGGTAGSMAMQGEGNEMGERETESAQAMVAEMLAAVRRMRLEAAVLIEDVAELRRTAIPAPTPGARP